jgi:aminoglycoside phosphotransferase (APT) family kinase protein
MPTLDEAILRWALDGAAPGARVTEVRGLRDGGTPWLVRYLHGGGTGAVVVRVGGAGNRRMFETEVAALRLLARHGLPGPRLLDVRITDDAPALVIELLPGSSAVPMDPPVARLRRLGAAAAAIHAVRPDPDPALPRRERPIGSLDFGALRREQEPRPLLVRAEAAIAGRPVPGASGFVHGDLWQGNALWQGDELSGLIDWDCAGVGPAGVDLGSLRCDAAVYHGLACADEVSRGWEAAAGRPAADVAYWDVVAALSTPPDMGWFVGAIQGQGRPDLTREVLIDRRDAFLADALSRLDHERTV